MRNVIKLTTKTFEIIDHEYNIPYLIICCDIYELNIFHTRINSFINYLNSSSFYDLLSPSLKNICMGY